MMIKAGIVVSAAAATLLAVSPLAFAGDYSDHGGHHKSHHKSHDHDKDKGRDHRGNSRGDRSCDQDTSALGSNGRGRGGGGLIDISGNTVQVPVQACNNNVLNNIGFGLLGRGSANGG